MPINLAVCHSAKCWHTECRGATAAAAATETLNIEKNFLKLSMETLIYLSWT
jgi:hypothetical protein